MTWPFGEMINRSGAPVVEPWVLKPNETTLVCRSARLSAPTCWMIGRTPLEMFRKDRDPMGLIAIGDQVRFRPITRAEFLAARRA